MVSGAGMNGARLIGRAGQQMPRRGPDRDDHDPGTRSGWAGHGAGSRVWSWTGSWTRGPAGPGPGNDIRIRGFQDGMDGAMRISTIIAGRTRQQPRPKIAARRCPPQPGSLPGWFPRGYQRGIHGLRGGPGSDRRFEGPGMETRTRGFQDGAEGAIRDFDNNRRPDPNNRDEYRHPNNARLRTNGCLPGWLCSRIRGRCKRIDGAIQAAIIKAKKKGSSQTIRAEGLPCEFAEGTLRELVQGGSCVWNAAIL